MTEKDKIRKKKAIDKAKKSLEINKNLRNTKRKKLYLYNTLSFIGIIIISLAVSFLSNGYDFEKIDFLTEKLSEKIALVGAIITFLFSFSSGIYVSYRKSRFDKLDFKVFLKDTYLDKIDSSSLNPNRK